MAASALPVRSGDRGLLPRGEILTLSVDILRMNHLFRRGKAGLILSVGLLILALTSCAPNDSIVVAPTPPGPTATSAEILDFRTTLPPAPAGLGKTASHIVFFSDRSGVYELYQMNLDGSGVTQLTHNEAYDMEPAWSPDGKLAFTSQHVNGLWEVFLMNPDSSQPTPLSNLNGNCWSLAWSPDGKSLAFVSDATGNEEIYLLTLGDGQPVNLTQNVEAADAFPIWSPDGKQIAFVSDRDGLEDIFSMAPDGSDVRPLIVTDGRDTSPAWSPDGRQIAFVSDQDGDFEVYVLDLASGDIAQLTNNNVYEWSPAWSPDGRQIAFTSTRASLETYDVFVMAADGSAQTQLIDDPANDIIPRWWP